MAGSLLARRSRRRRFLALPAIAAAVALVAVALGATVWAWAPSTGDAVARADAVARRHGGEPLAPAAVPPTLARALVATEDSSFYGNPGINPEGTARAAFFDVAHRCLCEGGSGISQQLAEDLYLRGADHSPRKYLVGAVLAVEMNRHLTKGQIIAAYFSQVYLGHGAYGAIAAAQVYFGKPLDRLTLTQYALLAGLPRAPSAYDPLLHPAAARARVAQVLAAMVAAGDVSAQQAAQAANGSL